MWMKWKALVQEEVIANTKTGKEKWETKFIPEEAEKSQKVIRYPDALPERDRFSYIIYVYNKQTKEKPYMCVVLCIITILWMKIMNSI